ncbi:hypothetical protein PSTT_01029, partial [Puccinia striiformis]
MADQKISNLNASRPWLPRCRCSNSFKKFTSGVPYITFTISFGLLVDMAAYGLMVPVLPFRLESIGYHNIPAKSSYLIAAFALGLIVSSVPIGIFGELVKARKTPLLFCLVFLAASLILFWLSSSFVVLIIARLLQGVSGTGIWTLGLALICDVVPEERIGVIMGYVMIGWSIGAVGGPLAGGLLYDSLGYHSVFIFALILTGMDFFLRLMVTDKPGQLPEIEDLSLTGDPALAIESSKEAGVLVNMAAEKNQSIEPSGKIKQVNHALISQSSHLTKPPSASRALLSLFSSSRCWTLFSIIFVLGLLDSGMTLLVHARYGLNSRGAALVFIGAVVPSFASSPLAGHFADKYGARWPVVICLILGTPFFGLISMEGSLSTFVVWTALTGLFIMGIAAPIMQDLAEVVKVTPGLGYAHVYGIFNMIYSTGSLVGPLSLCAASILPAWLYIGNKGTIKTKTVAPGLRPTNPRLNTEINQNSPV